MKIIAKYHFLPAFLSLFIIFSLGKIDWQSFIYSNNLIKNELVKGEKKTVKGWVATMIHDKSGELELDLLGSLLDKKGITLMASSELSNSSPYITYNYLPDSLGIRVNAFGHAYQQCFSIYCELLAFKKYLNGSRITIILSPGWFEQGGSNIEAFLEFVRPNFLKRIIKDNSIPIEAKASIGEFLFKHYDLIKDPNSLIDYFIDIYKSSKFPFVNEFERLNSLSIENVEYKLIRNSCLDPKKQIVNFEVIARRRQKEFLDSITNNKCFINDFYYKTYLLDHNGKMKQYTFSTIDTNNNQEYIDFKRLVDFLIEAKAKPTFMIQGLSPYYYKNLEGFNAVLGGIKNKLNQHKIPYLNMYTSKKSDFIPGSLLDVMHSSDYTWMMYNKFLIENY